MATYNQFTPQELGTVLRRSVNETIKIVSQDAYPWVSMLPIVPASGNYRHEWNSSGYKVFSSTISSFTSGSPATTTATIEVADAAAFHVGSTITVRGSASVAFQVGRITAIDTNTITAVKDDGVAWVDPAASAVIQTLATAQAYGTDDTLAKLEDNVLYTNPIQQFAPNIAIPKIIAKAKYANNENWMDVASREIASLIKQEMERQFLLGDAKEPAGSSGIAQANGLVNFLLDYSPNVSVGSLASNLTALINAIAGAERYRAFKGEQLVAIVDPALNAAIFTLQAASGGAVKIKDTQDQIPELYIAGHKFKYIVSTDLQEVSSSGCGCFLTWKDAAGQTNFERAVVEDDFGINLSLGVSNINMGALSLSTLKVAAPHTHMLFVNSATYPI